MCQILLSIQPQHVKNIFSGIKQYEYRKIKCREKVDRIIIYATDPIKKVVGEADVTKIMTDTPQATRKQTAEFSLIDKSFFDTYYLNRTFAVAYHLSNVKKYKRYQSLSEYGIKNVPQSFVYLFHNNVSK